MLKLIKKLWERFVNYIPAPKYSFKTAKDLADYFKKDVAKFGWWMEKNIWYAKDRKPEDEWRNPTETLKLGYGDCEDFAYLSFAVLREMKASYAEILAIQNKDGKGHAITVFRGFETNYYWWYDNGRLWDGCKISKDQDKDLEYICSSAADRQGWKDFTWRRTGFKHGEITWEK